MAEDSHGNTIAVTITVNSVANSVAECEDIVLRDSDQRRLLFRAMLVEGQEEGGVRGKLVYQRKKKADEWDDLDNVNLNTLKAGESVAIDIKTAELAQLRQWLNDLQLLKDEFGLPSNTKFIGVQTNPIAAFTGQDPISVLIPQSADENDVSEAIAAVLSQGNLAGIISALKDTPVEDLLALRQQLGLSALDRLLEEWDADPSNADEEHWQALLTKHSFALEQVFHAPSIIVDDKAYVGGKAVTNKGGNVVDFLLKTVSTGRAMLVEIKTPATELWTGTKPYRNNVWNMHKELTGATIQVLTYRDTLLEGLKDVDEEGAMLRRSPPRCAVIIGHSDTLNDDDRRRSFELYRDRPDVVTLTFDELRSRLQAIRDALVTANPG